MSKNELATNTRQDMLTLRNLTKKTGADDFLLRNLNLTLERGTITAITSLESPETTALLKIIATLDRATSGEIRLGKSPLRKKLVGNFPKEIAFSFGADNVFPNLTLLDNLYAGNKQSSFFSFIPKSRLKAQARQLLEEFNIPLDWNLKMEDLSHEFRVLVSICRILLQEADYYLLDRLTENISIKNYEIFRKHCLKLREFDKSVVLVPGDINQIFDFCDRVIVLRNGEVALDSQVSDTTISEVQNILNNTEYSINQAIVNNFNRYEKEITGYDELIEKSLRLVGNFTPFNKLFCCYYNESGKLLTTFSQAVDSSQTEILSKGVKGFLELSKEEELSFSVNTHGIQVVFYKIKYHEKSYGLLGVLEYRGEFHSRLDKIATEFSRCFFHIELEILKRNELRQLNGELAKQRDQLEASNKTLEKSKERYRTLVETIHEWIWETDHNLVYTYVSPKIKDLLGIEPKELLGKRPVDLIVEEDVATVAAQFKTIVQNRTSFKSLVNRNRHKDGRVVYLETSGVPIFDSFGDLVGYRGVDRDITDRWQAEEELRWNEENLRTTLNSIGDAVITTDRNGMVTRLNPVAEKLTGWSYDEALGIPLSQVFNIVNDRNVPLMKDAMSELLKAKPVRMFDRYATLIAKNGARYQVADNIAPIQGQGSDFQGIVLVFRDETEALKKERQLIQAQKMEAVGVLAGGLAHDFNNVLTGIFGPVSILENKLRRNKQVTPEILLDRMVTIRQSADRASEMVKQLLTISEQQEFSFIGVDLNSSVKHVVKVAQNTFDKSIEIIPQYCERQAIVNADPTQVEQVLLNLFINASHAMTLMREDGDPWGGKLEITIDKIHADRYLIKSDTNVKEGSYWMISIKDTGVGIEKEELPKIFDPFYTTKDKGKGTGLGLSMAYNIIKKHGGFVNVYSEPEIGTTFNLYLPEYDLQTGKEVSTVEEEIPEGEGLILIVDDEEVVRNNAREILEDCGYDTILAENGVRGVELYNKKSGDITLVLLDMVMPGISGKETYKKMKEINPDVTVLLASGFKQDGRVQEILNMGVQGFVQKPFDLKRLATSVKQLTSEK